MRINDTNGLLKIANNLLEELDQNAAGPELEGGAELKNEATEERAEKELASNKNNKDIYPADEHEQKEDVGEVVVENFSDIELMRILESNGYETTADNLIILKEGIASGKYVITEEELEDDPNVEGAIKAKVVDDEDNEEASEDEEKEEKKDEEKPEEDEEKEEKKEESEDEEKEIVDESFTSVLSLIAQINESLAQNAAGPELEGSAELKNEATEERAEKELTSNENNKDVYPADEHEQKEDVGEVVVKESDQLAAGPELEGSAELKNEATEERAEKELTSDKDNKDIFPADEHEQKEDVGEVIVKESDQNAAGPELEGAKKLDNEATEEKEPTTAEASTDNKDVYSADEHKQVEEVVEVVIEAVSICKSKGIPANHVNICEEVRTLLETKNFDIDTWLKSSDATGIKADKTYEENLRESVKYSSLKEACMLDEGYFAEDSYVKETADEKISKLTEQVSLLMARDAMDPLYDELLKESAYCMRLREQLQNKYNSAAIKRVNIITNN